MTRTTTFSKMCSTTRAKRNVILLVCFELLGLFYINLHMQPHTSKCNANIYGGIQRDAIVYYMPANVESIVINQTRNNNKNIFWIRSSTMNISEKLYIFNAIVGRETQKAYDKEKHRNSNTTQTLQSLAKFENETTQQNVFVAGHNKFKSLEENAYITTIYISPTSKIPIENFTGFTQNDYKNNILIHDFFHCTATEEVVLWGQNEQEQQLPVCVSDLNVLRNSTPHMNSRYFSYHGWDYNPRKHYLGMMNESDSLAGDWNLTCDYCTQYPNAVTFVHIIRNAVIVFQSANFQIDTEMKLLTLQCKPPIQRVPRVGYIDQIIQKNKTIRSRNIVFSIANLWQGSAKKWNYYHTVAESLTKLAPYTDFLRANPQVTIHLLGKFTMKNVCDIVHNYWKLNNEIIYGNVLAKVLILPEGNACFKPGYLNVQLTQQLLANNMNLYYSKPNSILYVQRTQTRKILEETYILDYLRKLTKRHNIALNIFSDAMNPSFSEVAHMFHSSLLTIGAHGAGLANILFATPHTAVVEVICEIAPSTFMHMSHKLGLRHHAFFVARIDPYYEKCNGGMSLKSRLPDLLENIETILDIVINDPYLT